jgi:hypothetical protein
MDFDYSNGELTVSKWSWQLVATKTTTVCTGDKLGAIAMSHAMFLTELI